MILNPAVSIIIPLFNKEYFVSRAIDSILKQSFTDFEVIVVDDGSTDDGPLIVKNYSDSRIRLITQSNKGPGAARNKGIMEARGQYVSFLDADDEWATNFLEISIKTLQLHPDIMLTTSLYCIDHFENLWRGYRFLNLQEGCFEITKDYPPSKLEYLVGALHAGGSLLCRKDVLIKYGGFYENNCMYAEDQFLLLQVVLNHKIYIINKILMIYHKENSGLAKYNMHRNLFKPVLREPDIIRKNCPMDKKELLEDFLGITALQECHNLFCKDTFSQILDSIKQFPSMKKNAMRYYILVIKILLYRVGIFRRGG